MKSKKIGCATCREERQIRALDLRGAVRSVLRSRLIRGLSHMDPSSDQLTSDPLLQKYRRGLGSILLHTDPRILQKYRRGLGSILLHTDSSSDPCDHFPDFRFLPFFSSFLLLVSFVLYPPNDPCFFFISYMNFTYQYPSKYHRLKH